MRRFFVDTFYLIALSNRRDQWHRRVVTFSRALQDVRLYTVDEVFAEFLTFSSTLGAHIRAQAARTVRHALHDPQWTVFPQSRTSLLDALTFYESRPDKEYGLTDCVSMQAMRHEGLTDVLSNDHHCTQEGFHIVFT
jgi:predicted nucleic acid-binding protein